MTSLQSISCHFNQSKTSILRKTKENLKLTHTDCVIDNIDKVDWKPTCPEDDHHENKHPV
jgi:hypothetical protein